MTSVRAVCAVLDGLLDRIKALCLLASSIALVVLVAIFAWLVFGRYVLNATPTWVEQLALVLVCYIAFLGAAAGVRERTHLGVDFIRESLPRPVRRALRILTDMIMAGFGLVMMRACIELVEFGWSTDLPMLNIPEGVRTMPAAICGGLVLLFAGARAIAMIERYWLTRAPQTEKAAD